MSISDNDPFFSREAEKYENPVASREFILELLRQEMTPLSLPQIQKRFAANTAELQEGLSRRLRAMERDGQVVCTRNRCYALPERMGVVKGKVIGHRDGYGFFHPEQGGADWVLSRKEMRKVLHGDTVLAQPLSKDRKGRQEARVVRVTNAAASQLVGRYFIENRMGFVVPDDTRYNQDILVLPEDTLGARQGHMVVVELVERPTARNHAVGKIIEVLGEHLDPGMEIEIAIRNHDIPHAWPDEVGQQTALIAEQVAPEHWQGRVDLRDLPLLTIDGEDARDFDDAVYCETKRSGGWRLWVAIADVSYYVRPGSALDREAQNRGNSVYFPNQVIPMLPEKLSNGLCSLNPDVDRLCMVCEMTISQAGRLSGYRFYPAVMRSHARLTYNKVAAILDGDAPLRERYSALVPHLEELNALYHVLTQMRQKRGAIAFETEETRFVFNAQRKIEQILPLVRNDAHKIIEECMILANVAAAKFIEKHDGTCLFRNHDAPGEERLAGFRSFLAELGLSLNGGLKPEPEDYSALLKQCEGRSDAELIQVMLLRSMRQAVYDADNIGHFGLALDSYAHFTSPIRRYPDLVLHRAIKYLLAKQQGQAKQKWVNNGGYHYQPDEVAHLGDHCSMTERRADEATRDVDNWLKCEYMLDHVGDHFDGVIASVTSFGFFVRLNDLHIDGLVHISGLQNDYYHYDANRQRLVGERFGRSYRIGDEVSIRVAAVNLDDRQIDFVLPDMGGSQPKGTKSAANKRKAKPVKAGSGKGPKGSRHKASAKAQAETPDKSKKRSKKKKTTPKGVKRKKAKANAGKK